MGVLDKTKLMSTAVDGEIVQRTGAREILSQLFTDAAQRALNCSAHNEHMYSVFTRVACDVYLLLGVDVGEQSPYTVKDFGDRLIIQKRDADGQYSDVAEVAVKQ